MVLCYEKGIQCMLLKKVFINCYIIAKDLSNLKNVRKQRKTKKPSSD